MDLDDVRRLARTLPGARENRTHGRFGFGVPGKNRKERGFLWTWMERIDPKKARVPNLTVLAVRVANETEKAALLDADTDVFFTEPHYNGYNAVLVRLPNIGEDLLYAVIVESWRCQAAPDLVAKLDGAAPVKTPARKAATRSVAKRPVKKRRAQRQ